MDLTPPAIAANAPAGNPLIERPPGVLPRNKVAHWTNRLVEEWATGLGPYQSRHDHYRVTVSGGHLAHDPRYDLPFAVGHSEAQLKALAEEVSACSCWKADKDRSWHQPYIDDLAVIAETPTYYTVEFTVIQPYLD
jgi:hypothetical protein